MLVDNIQQQHENKKIDAETFIKHIKHIGTFYLKFQDIKFFRHSRESLLALEQLAADINKTLEHINFKSSIN
jgi:hypothetical protein